MGRFLLLLVDADRNSDVLRFPVSLVVMFVCSGAGCRPRSEHLPVEGLPGFPEYFPGLPEELDSHVRVCRAHDSPPIPDSSCNSDSNRPTL